VTLAENVAALYSLQDVIFNKSTPTYPKVYRLRYEIPPWQRGKLLEWSYSNAVSLWNIGHRAALTFLKHAGNSTVPSEADRYFDTLTEDSREGDFLKLFGDPFKGGSLVVPAPSNPAGGS